MQAIAKQTLFLFGMILAYLPAHALDFYEGSVTNNEDLKRTGQFCTQRDKVPNRTDCYTIDKSFGDDAEKQEGTLYDNRHFQPAWKDQALDSNFDADEFARLSEIIKGNGSSFYIRNLGRNTERRWEFSVHVKQQHLGVDGSTTTIYLFGNLAKDKSGHVTVTMRYWMAPDTDQLFFKAANTDIDGIAAVVKRYLELWYNQVTPEPEIQKI